MNSKHAYLIIAHNHFEQLKKLIIMLDDSRNDIFIHIDKRVKKFNKNEYYSLITKSKLFFTKRVKVFWGDSSQVKSELILLEACLKQDQYEYIHLISGVDMPIKSQDFIHLFFDKHPNMQFLQIGDATNHLYRINKYHFFMTFDSNNCMRKKVDCFSDILMRKFSIDRLKKYGDITVVKSANWFSITGECAKYVVSQKQFINKLMRFSLCADEMFLGTVIANSKFWNQVYKKEWSWDGHMRYIDRIRCVGSSPHTFTIADKELLDSSDMLWARKFDDEVDNDIIEYIFNKYKG